MIDFTKDLDLLRKNKNLEKKLGIATNFLIRLEEYFQKYNCSYEFPPMYESVMYKLYDTNKCMQVASGVSPSTELRKTIYEMDKIIDRRLE